jgi:hypothetical protein
MEEGTTGKMSHVLSFTKMRGTELPGKKLLFELTPSGIRGQKEF